MALSWYQCRYCGTTIKKDSSPNTSGCTSKSLHSWVRLAEVGNNNYQCKKCGTLIQANASPNTSGCPEASIHSWVKL